MSAPSVQLGAQLVLALNIMERSVRGKLVVTHLRMEAIKRSSEVIKRSSRGHQEVIKRSSDLSTAHAPEDGGNQEVISSAMSGAISGATALLKARAPDEGGNQEVIRGHQRSSEVIRPLDSSRTERSTVPLSALTFCASC